MIDLTSGQLDSVECVNCGAPSPTVHAGTLRPFALRRCERCDPERLALRQAVDRAKRLSVAGRRC